MSGVSQARGSGLDYLGSFAWANRSSASANSGKTFFCSDINGGILLLSNAVVWRPLGGCLNFVSGVPVGLPSSGSIADNGALTVTTAFATTYESCYLYFPANAIAAGVAAGLYYCVMSSTTAGTIYNNTYTSGLPAVPASPTAFATTGPGAYTQTISADITLLSIPILGGFLGSNGQIEYHDSIAVKNSGNNKIVKRWLGTTLMIPQSALTTTSATAGGFKGGNRINAAKQSFSVVNSTNAAITRVTEDTTTDKNIILSGQLADATDYIVSEQIIIRIMPA